MIRGLTPVIPQDDDDDDDDAMAMRKDIMVKSKSKVVQQVTFSWKMNQPEQVATPTGSEKQRQKN